MEQGCCVILVGALVLALGSCSLGPSSSTGTVIGVFDGMANTACPPRAPCLPAGVPSPGSLTLTGSHRTYRTSAGTNGEFSINVPAGTYQIMGCDPGQTGGVCGCGALANVTANHVTHTVVTCVFH